MTTYFITLDSERERVEITDMDGKIWKVVNHYRDVMFFMGQVMVEADTLFASSSMDFPSEYTSDKDVLSLVADIDSKIFNGNTNL